MEKPLEVKACEQCQASRTEEDVVRCAHEREDRALCRACVDKAVAMRVAAHNAGFHVGL